MTTTILSLELVKRVLGKELLSMRRKIERLESKPNRDVLAIIRLNSDIRELAGEICRLDDQSKLETLGDHIEYEQAWVKEAYPRWVEEYGKDKARCLAMRDASMARFKANQIYDGLEEWVAEQERTPACLECGEHAIFIGYDGLKGAGEHICKKCGLIQEEFVKAKYGSKCTPEKGQACGQFGLSCLDCPNYNGGAEAGEHSPAPSDGKAIIEADNIGAKGDNSPFCEFCNEPAEASYEGVNLCKKHLRGDYDSVDEAIRAECLIEEDNEERAYWKAVETQGDEEFEDDKPAEEAGEPADKDEAQGDDSHLFDLYPNQEDYD